jgi:hypothetical protein
MRVCLILIVLALAACRDDSMTRNFGVSRDAGQANVAATQMPLSSPPNLAQRPIRPGTRAPRQDSQQEPVVGSAGQEALLQAAGPAATADIRQLIDENSGMIAPGAEFTDRLMNWTPTPGSTSLSQPAKKGWLSGLF